MAEETSTGFGSRSEEDATPARILIMDDDAVFAVWLKEVLEAAGYLVDWARDGTAALLSLETGSYDLLISDLIVYQDGRVTADGGITLMGRVKIRGIMSKRQPNRKLPVIAVSGATQSPGNTFILQTAKGLGADITLGKPVKAEEILEAAAQLLGGQPDPGVT